MKNNLPNFLIVGAAKSGTSSLHNYLNQHPNIFMPTYKKGVKVKEPRFFIKDVLEAERVPNMVTSINQYKSLFDDVSKEACIGEASVLYLYFYKTAIKNIKKHLGDNVKIIIMLRNPVFRAFSAYNHVARTSQENLSFQEALIKDELQRFRSEPTLTPLIMYKQMGMYYKMVKSYIDHFKDVHVIIYDDFINDTQRVVKDTIDFLGLDNTFDINTSSKYNVGGKRWRSIYLKNLFMKDVFWKKPVRFIFPFFIRKFFIRVIRLIFMKKNQYLEENIKNDLIEFFIDDIKKLENLLGVRLESWKK